MTARAIAVHPAALEEMKSAVVWYQQRSPSAASKLIAELDRAIVLATQSPEKWPAGEHGTRKFVLRRFPFAIVYRERDKGIQVLAFAHGHRQPGYWLTRL